MLHDGPERAAENSACCRRAGPAVTYCRFRGGAGRGGACTNCLQRPLAAGGCEVRLHHLLRVRLQEVVPYWGREGSLRRSGERCFLTCLGELRRASGCPRGSSSRGRREWACSSRSCGAQCWLQSFSWHLLLGRLGKRIIPWFLRPLPTSLSTAALPPMEVTAPPPCAALPLLCSF